MGSCLFCMARVCNLCVFVCRIAAVVVVFVVVDCVQSQRQTKSLFLFTITYCAFFVLLCGEDAFVVNLRVKYVSRAEMGQGLRARGSQRR